MSKNKFRAMVTVIATMCTLSIAQAGTFKRIDKGDIKDNQIWLYTGEVVAGDVPNLVKVLDEEDHVTIVIDSPGGEWVAGMDLGRETRKRRDEVTLIAKAAYSSAANWWMADDDRTFLDKDAEVGLHLPYANGKDIPEGQDQQVGYLMGSYYAKVLSSEDVAGQLMGLLADLRSKHGKFGLYVLKGDGSYQIRD